MKTRHLMVPLVLALMLAPPAAAGCSAGRPARPLRIAADLSLTGAGQELGRVAQRALTLEVQRVNARGGVPGGPLTLTVTDDRSDPAVAAASVRALRADPAVSAVVLGPSDDCLAAVAPVVRGGGAPVLSLAAAPLPAGPGGPAGSGGALFKLSPNASDDAPVLAAGMAARGARRIGVLAATGAYGDAAGAALTAAGTKLGLDASDRTGPTDTPGHAATALLRSGPAPDAVALLAGPAEATAVAAALRSRSFTGPLFLDAVAADELFLPPGGTLDGAYLVYPPTMAMDDLVAATPAKAAQKQWFDDYTSQYGGFAGPSTFAADAVQVVLAAASATGGDRGRLRAAIETTQLDGLSGPIQFTPANHSGLGPRAVGLLQAANGRWHQPGA